MRLSLNAEHLPPVGRIMRAFYRRYRGLIAREAGTGIDQSAPAKLPVDAVEGLHQPRAFRGIRPLEQPGLGLALGRQVGQNHAALDVG